MDLTDVRSSVRGQGRYIPMGCVEYDRRAKRLAVGKLAIIGSKVEEGRDILSLDMPPRLVRLPVFSALTSPRSK